MSLDAFSGNDFPPEVGQKNSQNGFGVRVVLFERQGFFSSKGLRVLLYYLVGRVPFLISRTFPAKTFVIIAFFLSSKVTLCFES